MDTYKKPFPADRLFIAFALTDTHEYAHTLKDGDATNVEAKLTELKGQMEAPPAESDSGGGGGGESSAEGGH